MKIIQRRTGKDYLSSACYSKRISHHHLPLAETQGRQGLGEPQREQGKFLPNWRLLAWEAGGGPTRNRVPMWLVRVSIWLSLTGEKVEVEAKKKKMRKLSDINQVLAIWGCSLQLLLFGFLDCFLEIAFLLWTSLTYREQAGFLNWLV